VCGDWLRPWHAEHKAACKSHDDAARLWNLLSWWLAPCMGLTFKELRFSCDAHKICWYGGCLSIEMHRLILSSISGRHLAWASPLQIAHITCRLKSLRSRLCSSSKIRQGPVSHAWAASRQQIGWMEGARLDRPHQSHTTRCRLLLQWEKNFLALLYPFSRAHTRCGWNSVVLLE